MAFTIHRRMHNTGADVYYDPAYLQIVADHKTYLRNHRDTERLPIDERDAYKYEHDLFGLLDAVNQLPQYHAPIMIVNDMVSPMEFTTAYTSLLIPSQEVLDRLRERFAMRHKIE